MTSIEITNLKAAGWKLDPVRGGYVSPGGQVRVRRVPSGWMAHGSNERLTIWCSVTTMQELAELVERMKGTR